MKQIACVFVLLAAVLPASAQTLTCTPSALSPGVHREGISEQIGDIQLACSAGSASGSLKLSLNVTLSVNVTNRVNLIAVSGVSVSQDNPYGTPTPLASSTTILSQNTIQIGGLSLTVSPQSQVNLRISGIRASATQAASAGATSITATVAAGTGLTFTSTQPLTVAKISPGVLAYISGTAVRFTEYYASAFLSRAESLNTGADTGTRFLIQLSGFPAGASVSVPNAIAGSSATVPTVSGQFGLPADPGQYTAGVAGGTLLLSLVSGADSNGAGGAPLFTPPAAGTVSLSGSTPVTLTNGAGYAVYEVLDENSNIRESAQFAVAVTSSSAGQGKVALSQAPLSSVLQADALAPVPRFIPFTPDLDCDYFQGCAAGQYPRLQVNPLSVSLTAQAGTDPVFQTLQIQNVGSGTMTWTPSISYSNGIGWLIFDQTSNRLSAVPHSLGAGVYQAALTIDAGPMAGSKTIPVTFTVTSGPPDYQAPVVAAVVNAATNQLGPIQAGSIATLWGDRLTPTPAVKFDELPASVLYAGTQQVNVLVPAALSGRTSSLVTVTNSNGVSTAFPVQLAALAPAIFGTLNQDYGLNAPGRPAPLGSYIQIFLTGASAPAGAVTTVKIFDHDNLQPAYAGQAPGIPGLQQVNVQVPVDLIVTQTQLIVCVAPDSSSPRVCSAPAPLTLSH